MSGALTPGNGEAAVAADPFHLERFVTAQAPVFAAVVDELRRGRKQTHWMWFVFPQLRGLGRSTMADFYGIGSLAEARAYVAHSLLGPRLVECTQHVSASAGRSLAAIFGSPDDQKFHSCMTLFAQASGSDGSAFRRALELHCGGRQDAATLALLEASRFG